MLWSVRTGQTPELIEEEVKPWELESHGTICREDGYFFDTTGTPEISVGH